MSDVFSMTGFSRQEGGDGTMTWAWEVKSVNGKSLDVRPRLAAGFETLESAVRQSVQAKCARGNLQVALTINRSTPSWQIRVNRDALDQVLAIVTDLERQSAFAPPSLDGILALKGVLETAEAEEDEDTVEARLAVLAADLDLALEALRGMRREEGARLAGVVAARLDEIEALTHDAAQVAASQPDALREKLKRQVEELLEASPALPEERLAQEAAILASKSDLREELDRLSSHIEAARSLLAEGGPIGRKLDFLCQEFNRKPIHCAPRHPT